MSDRSQCQTCRDRGGLTLPREVVSGMGGGAVSDSGQCQTCQTCRDRDGLTLPREIVSGMGAGMGSDRSQCQTCRVRGGLGEVVSGMGAGLCQIVVSVTVSDLSWQGWSDIAERGGVRDGGRIVSDRG